MERVLNQEMQPLVLEDGTLLAAAGSEEAGPREVELSEKDRKLYVRSGRLASLKPVANNQGSIAPAAMPPTPPAAENKIGKAGK